MRSCSSPMPGVTERGSSPRVTVLLAVRDGARYLREALVSVLEQSFTSFELLVVDDGSTDETPEILQSYRDSRLVVLHNAHSVGLTRSLNIGLRAARGEYIARLDADDACEPDRLATQVAFLESHPDVAALATGYVKIDSAGRSHGPRPAPLGRTDLRWRLLFHNPLVHSSVMIRTRVLDAVGGFDEAFRYAQDYALWCRIVRRMPIETLQDPLVRFRVHGRSITETAGGPAAKAPLDIAVGYLRDVISTARLPREEYDEEFAVDASRLLYPRGIEPGYEDLRMLAAKILRLHDAFCRYYRLDGVEKRDRDGWLSALLRRRLLELAAARMGRRQPLAALGAASAALRVSGSMVSRADPVA